jgi:hypothetical protein
MSNPQIEGHNDLACRKIVMYTSIVSAQNGTYLLTMASPRSDNHRKIMTTEGETG